MFSVKHAKLKDLICCAVWQTVVARHNLHVEVWLRSFACSGVTSCLEPFVTQLPQWFHGNAAAAARPEWEWVEGEGGGTPRPLVPCIDIRSCVGHRGELIECAGLALVATLTLPNKGNTQTNRTSRQPRVGIGRSAPTHRGGHVQHRSRPRRGEQRRCRSGTGPQTQTHEWTYDKAGAGSATLTWTGAGESTPQMIHQAGAPRQQPNPALHAPSGMTAKGGSRVERDKTSRGRHNCWINRCTRQCYRCVQHLYACAAPICAAHHTSQVQILASVPGSCMWHA